MSLLFEIEKDYQHCFKRIKIKRRLLIPGSSYYETSWYDVTSDIFSVDPIVWNIDHLELNNFTQGGFGLTCKNDLFKWANESYSASYFYGFLTRHKTEIKIEAGYIADDGTEYPYDIGAGLIVGDEINTQSDGTIYIPCIAPSTLFDETPADYVNEGLLPSGETDWYDTKLVSEVAQYLYDLQIGGAYVFHPFLAGADIAPGNDIVADLYDFRDYSCLQALDKMAEVSNSAHWVGADFRLKFQSKEPSASVQFTFNGTGIAEQKTINILRAFDYNEGLRNVFNRIAWYNTDPLIESVESWKPGDNSSTWKYGQRTYSVDNRLVTSDATRQTVCDSLFAAYFNPKEEVTIETKFVPQLKLLDRVKLNYYGDPSVSPASLWGHSLFGSSLFTGRQSRGGIKISKEMKIIKIIHDVMSFKSTITLREI